MTPQNRAALGSLAFVPDVFLFYWGLFVLAAGVFTLLAGISASTSGALVGEWHVLSTTLAGWLLLPLPFVTLSAVRLQCRVWKGRIAPRSAVQQTLRDHGRTLWLSGSLAALPLCMLRLVAHPEGEPWAHAVLAAVWTAALLAALLGTALLLAAAANGLLGWPWGVLAGTALFALLAQGPQRLPAWTRPGMGWAFELPLTSGLVAGLTALLAPLAVRLVQERLAQAQAAEGLRPGPIERLKRGYRAFAGRWDVVDKGGFHLAPVLAGPLAANITNPNSVIQFFQPLGSDVTASHGLRIATLAVFAASVLWGPALHWRNLLAPGGHFRRDIGLHLVACTLTVFMAFTVAAFAVVSLLTLLVPFFPTLQWAQLPSTTASYGPPLLADLTLAIALAAWLRGWLGSPTRVLAALAAFGVLLAAAVLAAAPHWGLEGFPGPSLWVRGPGHLAGQFALAALLTVLAQRAWARADLTELARRPQPQADEPVR